jgi:hypothetical protein
MPAGVGEGHSGMLTCAEYEGDGPISAAAFGPVGLSETVELREHRRDDLITKLVHFNDDPRA